jgi:hypothetical protein
MDYRKLNNMIIKNQYLLPWADNIQERLQKAIIFI